MHTRITRTTRTRHAYKHHGRTYTARLYRTRVCYENERQTLIVAVATVLCLALLTLAVYFGS